MKGLKRGVLFLVVMSTTIAVLAESPERERIPSRTSWEAAFNVRLAVRAGVMGEHVYAGPDTLSYLEWDLLPLVTVGPSIAVETPFHLTARVSIELPMLRTTGTMTNADYLDPADRSVPTKLSTHTALVDAHRTIDFSVTQRVFSEPGGSLYLGVGYIDRFMKMIAADGTYDYSGTSGDVRGVAITYQQHHRIPYALVSARARSTDDFEVVTKLSMAPYIFVDALDHHHRRLLDFHDTVRGAYWIEGEVGFAFTLWGQSVEITGFGEFIPETKGDTYTVDYNTNSFEGVTGPTVFDGAGISWWNAGVYVTLRYGW